MKRLTMDGADFPRPQDGATADEEKEGGKGRPSSSHGGSKKKPRRPTSRGDVKAGAPTKTSEGTSERRSMVMTSPTGGSGSEEGSDRGAVSPAFALPTTCDDFDEEALTHIAILHGTSADPDHKDLGLTDGGSTDIVRMMASVGRVKSAKTFQFTGGGGKADPLARRASAGEILPPSEDCEVPEIIDHRSLFRNLVRLDNELKEKAAATSRLHEMVADMD